MLRVEGFKAWGWSQHTVFALSAFYLLQDDCIRGHLHRGNFLEGGLSTKEYIATIYTLKP